MNSFRPGTGSHHTVLNSVSIMSVYAALGCPLIKPINKLIS